MDPEQIREFEENLRRINEMLGQQSAAMASMTQSMQNNSSAMKKNTEASKENTNGSNVLTKAKEAEQKAAEKGAEASANFRDALNSSKTALNSFSSALFSGTEGFAKYGSALGSLGDASLAVGKNFGLLGIAVGGAIKGMTMVGELALKQADDIGKATDSIARMGAANQFTGAQIAGLGHAALLSSAELDKFIKPMQAMGSSFKAMGTGSADATKTFFEMAQGGRDAAEAEKMRANWRRMGFADDQARAEAMAKAVDVMVSSGTSIDNVKKGLSSLAKITFDYQKNLTVISEITGKTAEQQAEQQKINAANIQWQVYEAQMNKKMRETSDAAEAEKIRKELESASKTRDLLASRYGEKGAAMAGQYYSGAPMTIGVPEMAMQGTKDEVYKLLEGGKQGMSAEDQGKLVQEIAKKQQDTAVRFGTPLSVDQSGSLAKTLGFDNPKSMAETNIAASRDSGKAGKTAETAVGGIEKGEGAAATDPMQKSRDFLIESEKKLKTAADELLLSMNPLVKGFDAGTIATAALTAAAIAAAAALTYMAGKAALGQFGGGGKGGKPKPKPKPRVRDAKGRFTKAKPSMFSRATGALGKMTKPLAGLARGAGRAAKFIPGVGLIAAGGMAAYDAYSGYKNAGENLGIKGREATTGEKFSSAAGSALSGLTFGLVAADSLSKAIAKATGAGPSTHDAAKEAQKKHAAQMAATDKSKEKTEASIATTSTKIETDQKTIDQSKELQETTEIRSKNEGAALNSLIRALDDATVKLGIFGSSLQTLASTINGLGPGGGTAVPPDGSGSPSGEGAAPANLASYMATTAMIESGGNANARAKTSSAGGMFQFLDGTWKQLTREMGKNYSVQDKFDPRKAAEVMAYFTAKNKKQLEKSIGRPASNTDLYMAHFLGAGGASKFLNAMGRNPNALAADMDPAAARANKNIYYDESGRPRTLKQVYDVMSSKYNEKAKLVAKGEAPKFVQEMAAQGGMKPGGGGPGPSGDLAGYFNFRSPSGDETDFRGMNGALQNALLMAAQDYKSQTGKKLTINSAKRSAEDGQRLWDETVKRGTPGKGPTGDLVAKPGRSPHERGVGVDIQEYGDPRALAALSRAGLTRPYGMRDKVHFELQARDGGIFDGPKSGYPVEMHGAELITPLNANSILAEMAKTPANATTEESTKPITRTNDTSEKVMNMNAEMLAMLSDKLDTMIEALENGNDTSNKLLKASRV